MTQSRPLMPLTKMRPLILGPFITQLAVNENLIDLDDLRAVHLHLACDMMPLDLKCLKSMGLIYQEEDGSFSFIPTGPILQQRGNPTTGTATPSTSIAPGPSSSRSIEEHLDRLKAAIMTLTTHVTSMDAALLALCHHFGISPPTPPS
ncbi:hypothetical protein GH714_014536 [Hevea brasiliensis]|uniref:Uncharacterized protein n=1 Tax=Hevea brasiliensis TaxID=3981 RepID=A0A6A6K4R9_HEVBR|nr:hypothetical protein GH714_014536 [Hevea brasiliensis]